MQTRQFAPLRAPRFTDISQRCVETRAVNRTRRLGDVRSAPGAVSGLCGATGGGTRCPLFSMRLAVMKTPAIRPEFVTVLSSTIVWAQPAVAL
jgi:hypothetical protein